MSGKGKGKRPTIGNRTTQSERVIEDAAKNPTNTVSDVQSRVISRVSPHALYQATRKMTDEQKSIVQSIGFGSILEMGFYEIPARLGCYVVDNFSYTDSSIYLSTKSIQITRESIHDMLGVPSGGTRIVTGQRCKKTDSVTIFWRNQFKTRVIMPRCVLKKIEETKDIEEEVSKRLFVLNFLVLFATCMVEGNQLGSCNTKFLPYITSIDQVSKLDWCGYILECLIEAGREWSHGGKGALFCGSLSTLILHYLDSTQCASVRVTRKQPLITWTTSLLKEREDAEFNERGFRQGEKKRKKQKPMEEEGIIKSLSFRYQKLVSSKKEMEECLEFCSQVCPHNEDYKEIINKVQILCDEMKSLMRAPNTASMASSSSKQYCFQCQDSTSICFRDGWRLRNGECAQLCNLCAYAYEEGRFCETFHSNDDGWRDCKSCGKLVHCGCVASFNQYFLLDFAGVICRECFKKNLIPARNRRYAREFQTDVVPDVAKRLQIEPHY